MRAAFWIALSCITILGAGCEKQSEPIPDAVPPVEAPAPEPAPTAPQAQPGQSKPDDSTKQAATSPAPATAPQADAAPVAPAASATPVVEIETSMGTITVELTRERTPVTVENFLRYVDEKHYDGTIFHRVIDGFMIQGGGFRPDLQEKPTHEPIVNESDKGLSNTPGTIAMARKNDPNSATSQFYINVANNTGLDRYSGGYTVFGRVVEGMDVVNSIAKVQTRTRDGFEGLPVETVEIRAIRRK